MGVQLEKPYTIDEIRKHPIAVVISLLIGLLLLALGCIAYLFIHYNSRIDELTDKADKEKTKRIEQYETMIFYKGETERLQHERAATDSLIRQRTQPFVDKILKHEQ
jgi:flagellar basal body-associated protein FliL